MSTASVLPVVEPVQFDAPSGGSAIESAVQRTFEPTSFGAFVPSSVGQVEGGFGTAVSQGWRDGILGFITRPTEVDLAEQDRIVAEAANYAEEHGILNFLGGVIGGAASDAPIEIGLLLTGAPLLSSMGRGATRLGLSGTARNLDEAAQALRLAEQGNVRFVTRAKYNASVGALAGIVSEYSQQALGKDGDFSNVFRRATEDAIGSVVFAEVLRYGGRLYGKAFKRKVTDDIKSAHQQNATAPPPVSQSPVTTPSTPTPATASLTQAQAGPVGQSTPDATPEVDPARRGLPETVDPVVALGPEDLASAQQAPVVRLGEEDLATSQRPPVIRLGRDDLAENQVADLVEELEDEVHPSLIADFIQDRAQAMAASRATARQAGAEPDALTRVAITSRLRKITDLMDEGSDSSMRDAEFEIQKLLEQKTLRKEDRKLVNEARQRVRGPDFLREKLLNAKRKGDVTEEAADLAEWLIKKNEGLVDDLGISIRKPGEKEVNMAGFYTPLNRVITLLKHPEGGSDLTAIHEILHHFERFIPEEFRAAIRTQYSKRIAKLLNSDDAAEIAYARAVLAGQTGNKAAAKGAVKMLVERKVPREHYQFMNLSEFWAVNGADLLAKRFDVEQGGVWDRFKNWLSEMWDRVKEIVGGESNAPLLRALDNVINGDAVEADVATSQLAGNKEALANVQPKAKAKRKTKAKPKSKKVTQAEINKQRAIANAKADTGIAKQANKDFHKGTSIPKTRGAKRFWKAMRSVFPIMTVNNMSLMDTLKGLGPTMNSIVDDMKLSLDKSSEVKGEMMDHMQGLGLTVDDIGKLSDNKTKKSIMAGGKSYRLNGIQRISAWLSMADGVSIKWLKGGPDFETNNLPSSGYSRMVEHTTKKGKIVRGPGIRLGPNRKPVVFTDAEFKNFMLSDSLLSDAERKIAMRMLESYNMNVPWLNQVYLDLLGYRLIKGNGKFAYSPLRSEGHTDPDEIITFNAMLGKGKKPETLDVTGHLKQRGSRVVTLEDPFAQFNNYVKRVPDAVAYARPTRIALHALGAVEGAPQTLKNSMMGFMGNTAYRNTVNMLRNLVGDRSGIKDPTSPGFGQMISLANMAKLSLNPITALKQWGSLWSAQASKVVPGLSGNKVWVDAVALTTNKKERDALIAEARAASPFFDYRQRDRIAFIDDEALQGDDFARLMTATGNTPSIKDLKAMVKRKKLTRRQAWYEMVSRGLNHIKFADEVALAALWKATKEAGGDGVMLRDLILESQPSYDNLSRSINQLNRDEFSRSIAAFSTQTRKNAAMMTQAYYNLINKDKITTDDWREFFGVVGPMLYQTSYITAAGTVGAIGVGTVLSLLESEEVAARNENLREITAKKIMQRFSRDLLGQIPSIGGDAVVMLTNQLMGATSFAAGITPITDFEEAIKTISVKDGQPKFNTQQFIRAMSGTFGSRFAGQIAASASTRITD